MVDATLLKRWALPAAATVATVALVAMASVGKRENTSLAEFKPAGLTANIPLDRITEVEVRSPARAKHFRRAAEGWSGGDAADGAGIEEGLKLLRNAAPEREFTKAESGNLADFGLAPSSLQVTLRGDGVLFAVEFGQLNPMGLARYARVVGSGTALLVPGYVADPWQRLVAKP